MDKQVTNQQLNEARHIELLALSRSYSGYTREDAVIELQHYPSEKSIDALIERVNDWVPEVRRAAQYILAHICQEDTAQYFISKLNKLTHLRECKRENHSEFVDKIEQELIRHSVIDLTHLNSCNSSSAVIYAKLLKKSNSIDLLTLSKACLKHSHASVRLYAISLSSKLEADDRHAFLLRCIDDSYGAVRRDAFRLLLKLSPESGTDISMKLLYDKEKTVRVHALVHLKNNGLNCTKEFTNQLKSENLHLQRVAIWGLTEIFAKNALGKILPFLDSNYASIRALALKACFVLSEDETLETIFEKMLNDTSPRVIRECSKLYDTSCVRIKNEQFKRIISNQTQNKSYRFIIKMTHRMNKWDQLILLSEISRLANPSLQTEIEKATQLWLTKLCNFFIDPTEEQIEKLKSLNRHEKRHWTSAVKRAINQRSIT